MILFFRQFLEHFVKEKGLDFLNMLPGGVIGVYIALYALVLFVVVLASILILTYYRYIYDVIIIGMLIPVHLH